jgi:hypothetical protein
MDTRREDLLDDRRDAGSRQQQGGAAAPDRATRPEAPAQAREQRGGLDGAADQVELCRRERAMRRVNRDREIDLRLDAANTAAERCDGSGIAAAEHRLVAGPTRARVRLPAIPAQLTCHHEAEEQEPQHQTRSNQHDQTGHRSHGHCIDVPAFRLKRLDQPRRRAASAFGC